MGPRNHRRRKRKRAGPKRPLPAPRPKSSPLPRHPVPRSPGTPSRPGDVLAKHYEIVEFLESTPERVVYRARDLQRCANCGYDDNLPDDLYCRNCGASLDKPAYVRITEEVRRRPEQYDLQFSEGDRDYYVTAEPQPELPPAPPRRQAGAPCG